MNLVQIYAVVGWAAIAAMAGLYLAAAVGRKRFRIGMVAYLALAATALTTVGLRFAEAL